MADQRQPERDQLSDLRSTATETGRVNQKLRTRHALIEAAQALLAAGVTPTLADVAEHALISKTTAYRYFASADALLAEVFFDRDFPTVDTVLQGDSEDPAERVLAAEEAINNHMLANERAMRMIIRNALETALTAPDDSPPRIGRRQKLIEAAVKPLAKQLEPERLDVVRAALALVIGPEAIITARDVCGLTAGDTRTVTRWATEAIIARAIAEAAAASPVSAP